jgi:acyl-coenzyme A synthetase/AMP-(fatty) acid ligase
LYIEERADDVLNIGGAKIRKLAPSRPDKVFWVTEFARTVTGKGLRRRLLEVLSEQAV